MDPDNCSWMPEDVSLDLAQVNSIFQVGFPSVSYHSHDIFSSS